MEFVYIPAGEFTMGASPGDKEAYDDEKPAHKVRITKGFYIAKYPVTQEQWIQIMGDNPSEFKDNPKHPVEIVSWDDTKQFLEKLNSLDSTENGEYRLPTEAEWEYAARAGSTTKYYFGDDESKLEEYAWFDKNSGGKTRPVGEKLPNAFGLYDMLGNVDEWCEDKFESKIYQKRQGVTSDPLVKTGKSQVVRGGSWSNDAVYLRVSYRDIDSNADSVIGFRLLFEAHFSANR